MALPQATTAVKLENSPADSLLSVADDSYTSLFTTTPSSATSPATMNPMEMMTPQSYAGDRHDSPLPTIHEDDDDVHGQTDSPDSDKKTKKRKSWGQVLPEPKTNLPPRKRAKTDDEKEQRRVERVLRNRRAAQSSRERKRLEVEALEQRNKELEDLLINAQKANIILVEELNRFRRDSGVVARSSSPLETLRDNNITLSPELFSAQGLKVAAEKNTSLVDGLISANPTVNPASLSPSLGPVPDSAAKEITQELPSKVQSSETDAATSSDLTQHPAEVLSDLQCHMSVEVPKSFQNSQTALTPLLAWSLQLRMLLLSASAILSACQRPLTQIAMSSKAGFSLLPTPQLLTTIIWLVTLPPASQISQTSNSSTSTTSSMTRQTMSLPTLWQRATMPLRTTGLTSRSRTLRLKSLRKILSSSPLLARPLMDATLVALRLVSEGREDRVGNLQCEPSATRDQDRELTQCLSGIKLPSQEVLLTLLWALKVETRKAHISRASLDSVKSGPSEQHNQNIILKIKGQKRMGQQGSGGSGKRHRLR